MDEKIKTIQKYNRYLTQENIKNPNNYALNIVISLHPTCTACDKKLTTSIYYKNKLTEGLILCVDCFDELILSITSNSYAVEQIQTTVPEKHFRQYLIKTTLQNIYHLSSCYNHKMELNNDQKTRNTESNN